MLRCKAHIFIQACPRYRSFALQCKVGPRYKQPGCCNLCSEQMLVHGDEMTEQFCTWWRREGETYNRIDEEEWMRSQTQTTSAKRKRNKKNKQRRPATSESNCSTAPAASRRRRIEELPKREGDLPKSLEKQEKQEMPKQAEIAPSPPKSTDLDQFATSISFLSLEGPRPSS